LAQEIDALNDASARPCPFSTFAFLSAYLETYHPLLDDAEASVLVLLAFSGERLVGFLPLRRQRKTGFGRTYTRLEWLATREGDRPHLVADPEHEAMCADAFLDWLRADRTWSAMAFDEQDEWSPLRAAVHALPRWRYLVIERPALPSAIIPIQWTTLEDYYRSLNRKMRRNTARLASTLFAAGDVGYVTSDDPQALEALLEVFLDIEARSWKAGTNAAVGERRRRVTYLRAMLGGRTGMQPSMGIVTLSGEPIAATIEGTFANRVHVLKMAYDDAYSAVGAGRFLTFLRIGDAIRAGRRECNLLSGYGYYKARLGANVIETTSLRVLRVGRLPFHHAIVTKVGRIVRRRRRSTERLDHNPVKRRAVDTSAPRAKGVELEARRARLEEIMAGPGCVRHETHDQLSSRLPFPVAH
jgi:CelD/BcsL family acetyltransferase involved in cellulose biosynthesis